MTPFVSIITPTYNRAHKIAAVIESVRAQTYYHWELIIIDDGSQDHTKEIVAKYEQKDSRIRYVMQPNAGASSARNTGVGLAQGEWVVYIDSDDPVYPNFLQIIYDALQNNTNALYGIVNHQRFIELFDGQNLLAQKEPFVAHEGEVSLQDFYHWKVKTTSTGLFHKKSLFENDIHWDNNLRYIEDWELLLQCGARFPKGFVHVRQIGFDYHQQYGTTEGMCANATYKNWAEAFDMIYQKHKDDPLMQGQKWWPDRVNKYTQLHQNVIEGKEPPAFYKYFPEFYIQLTP